MALIIRPPPIWLSISAYARVWGIDRATVYKWLAAGLLDHYRVGRCIRVKDQQPRTVKE